MIIIQGEIVDETDVYVDVSKKMQLAHVLQPYRKSIEMECRSSLDLRERFVLVPITHWRAGSAKLSQFPSDNNNQAPQPFDLRIQQEQGRKRL